MEDQTPQAQAPMVQSPVMALGEWMIIMLLMAIPIVNIIMLLVWAFSGEINPSKSNFAKAALIWTAIWIVFSILLVLSMGAIIGTAASQY